MAHLGLRLSVAAIVLLLATLDGSSQINLEDRQLQGTVGLTNTVLVVPDIDAGNIEARSVGLASPLNNIGAVFGGTPLMRNHSVVVQAYDGGSYWLSTSLNMGPQSYTFGYAANTFATPGFPNFINGVFSPNTVSVTPASPDPITGVNILECAGKVRITYLEADGGGGFILSPRERDTIIRARPRMDPADAITPYTFLSAPQAAGSVTGLFVRQSPQNIGPDVLYQVEVLSKGFCDIPDPECPPETPIPKITTATYFEGVTADFGSFGASGGAGSAPGENAGLMMVCDEIQDLFIVLEDQICPPCLPDPGEGTFEGCVDLIGEDELFSGSRTSVTGGIGFDSNISNSGQSPGAFSPLFQNFTPANSEGIYNISSGLGANPSMRSRFYLAPSAGLPLNSLTTSAITVSGPPPNTVVTGPDFCMVPGIYSGTISLTDSLPAGTPTGALLDLQLAASSIQALGAAGGIAVRNYGNAVYDGATGSLIFTYENIFANPTNAPDSWTQGRMIHEFKRDSPVPFLFTEGALRLEFSLPDSQISFDPADFISTSAGGNWAGGLLPTTEIATRDIRTTPVDYEVCYATLSLQINSQTVQFFDPLINSLTGSYQDDAGTPLDPLDDTSYGVFLQKNWLGSPFDEAGADTRGFVNLRLPQGNYTDISGTIRTVLAPGVFGLTQLPSIALSLGCADTCTATPNAIVCLSPIEACNDPAVVSGVIPVSGTLNHDNPISQGGYRINGGIDTPIDLTAAGITCSPAPCDDTFTFDVAGIAACGNIIEIEFIDDQGNPISAFLDTTLDTSDPVYLVNPNLDPATPPYICGTELHVTPSADCDSVPRATLPLPVVADDCSAAGDPLSPLISTDDAPGVFPFGRTDVTLSTVDSCGNGANCIVPVIIEDTLAPSVTCGAGQPPIFEADDVCLAAETVLGAAADNCDTTGEMTLSYSIDFPDQSTTGGTGLSASASFPLGVSDVSFMAIDTQGNSGTCQVPVTVVDVTIPVLNCPFSALGAMSPTGPPQAATIPSPQWLDGITLLFTDQTSMTWSGSIPGYSLYRNSAPVIGVDPMLPIPANLILDNSASTEFTELTPLNAGEVLFFRVFGSGAAAEVFECESPDGRLIPLIATGADNCAIDTVSNDRTGASLDATDTFPLGSTNIIFRATDTSGNLNACGTQIEVVDSTPPTIQCPPPLVISTNDPAGLDATTAAIAGWLASATGSDICGAAPITHDAPVILPSGCDAASGTTVVQFTATDQAALTASCTSTITIQLDQDGDGALCDVDCDDTDPSINQSATELCDGLDNNCDTAIDEDFPGLGGACSAGVGACTNLGTLQCSVDGLGTTCDAIPGIPTAEVCDGIDNDCDGQIDNGCGRGKVTGGGEISVPGGESNYGFIVQRKKDSGPVTGQLEYINHARGINVHSTSMTSLIVNAAGTEAMFTGTCTKNGSTPCTFAVTIQDNGEPGFGVDVFIIDVSDEAVEGDTGPTLHGNIQIH